MTRDGTGRAAPDRARSDAWLDAIFAATDTGVLAAIRQGIDLDSGLAQIIGGPSWFERHFPEPPADNDESPTDSWRLY